MSHLQYRAISLHLVEKHVLTVTEKQEIDKLRTNRDKMERVVMILYDSLKSTYTKKYKDFLKIMEESEDGAMKYMAEKLGKYVISIYSAQL